MGQPFLTLSLRGSNTVTYESKTRRKDEQKCPFAISEGCREAAAELRCTHLVATQHSLHMQIPSAEVFDDSCSCFPGQACQTSHGGPANQGGKQGLGGQVGPFSCQRCPSSPSSPSSPLCPQHHSSTTGAPILHFHSSILLPLWLSPS